MAAKIGPTVAGIGFGIILFCGVMVLLLVLVLAVSGGTF